MKCWRKKGLCALAPYLRDYWRLQQLFFSSKCRISKTIMWIYISEYSSIIHVYPLKEEIWRPQLLGCAIWMFLTSKNILGAGNSYIFFFFPSKSCWTCITESLRNLFIVSGPTSIKEKQLWEVNAYWQQDLMAISVCTGDNSICVWSEISSNRVSTVVLLDSIFL